MNSSISHNQAKNHMIPECDTAWSQSALKYLSVTILRFQELLLNCLYTHKSWVKREQLRKKIIEMNIQNWGLVYKGEMCMSQYFAC